MSSKKTRVDAGDDEPTRPSDVRGIAELIARLVQQRIWVASVTLVGIALAVIAALLADPVYESTAAIRIGQAGRSGSSSLTTPIEPPDDVVARLRNQFRSGADGSTPRLIAVESDRRAPQHVAITAAARTPEQAQQILQELTQAIVAEHRAMLESYRGQSAELLTVLESELREVERDIRSLVAQVATLKERNATLAALLTLEKAKLYERRLALQGRRTELLQVTGELLSRPTSIVAEPNLPERPTHPRWSKYTAVGAFLGLAAGVVLALVVIPGAGGRTRTRRMD